LAATWLAFFGIAGLHLLPPQAGGVEQVVVTLGGLVGHGVGFAKIGLEPGKIAVFLLLNPGQDFGSLRFGQLAR
jgi:hypothetical protein